MIWLTGLPCSGKTTIAYELHNKIENSVVFDGDEIRNTFNADVGRGPEGRREGHRRITEVAKQILRDHSFVIVSVVSPDSSLRQIARSSMQSSGYKYIEVYVKASLEVCIKRDVKGMYQRALSGEDFRIAGLNEPYEEPIDPEVVCDTDRESLDICVEKILTYLSSS
jgi:adenylylsulfate kinase